MLLLLSKDPCNFSSCQSRFFSLLLQTSLLSFLLPVSAALACYISPDTCLQIVSTFHCALITCQTSFLTDTFSMPDLVQIAQIMASTSRLPLLPADMPTTSVEVDGVTVDVPTLLHDCFNYILSEALVEGVFRVSGSARRMKLISADYSLYIDWLQAEKKPSAHDVAGVIKKFLREYLDSSDGLFSSSCLSQLHRLYVSHSRSNSDMSMDSFKSASTSLGSAVTLPSVVEDATDSTDSTDSTVTNPDALLETVSHLILTKNVAAKNNFFIYLLLQLKQLSLHEDKTKMTVANLSIIFQPYIFHTKSLSELLPFQALLTFLVHNYDSFVQKYVCYKNIVGGLEELDIDTVSVTSSESFTTSPITVYSSHQSSPSKNSSDRRKSVSQRFSIFWDSYNLPANRSKRFSLNFGSKSPDKMQSSENLTRERRHTAVSPHEMLRSSENLWHVKELRESTNAETEQKESHVSTPISDGTCSPTSQSVPTISSPVSQRPPMPKRASSKRKSFIGLFRSSLSVNSIPPMLHDLLSPVAGHLSPKTPPVDDLKINTQGLSSVEDLLISDQKCPLNYPEQKSYLGQKSLLGRNFSMRLKRK